MEIQLINKENILSIIPLLRLLNPAISEATLRERLTEMVSQGYACVGMYENTKLIGICGLWIVTKYYVGKHIEPDNMIFLPDYRSRGFGKKLMDWVYEYGKSQGCVASELNCYVGNKHAHRFWEQEGYEVIALHFQKNI